MYIDYEIDSLFLQTKTLMNAMTYVRCKRTLVTYADLYSETVESANQMNEGNRFLGLNVKSIPHSFDLRIQLEVSMYMNLIILFA